MITSNTLTFGKLIWAIVLAGLIVNLITIPLMVLWESPMQPPEVPSRGDKSDVFGSSGLWSPPPIFAPNWFTDAPLFAPGIGPFSHWETGLDLYKFEGSPPCHR